MFENQSSSYTENKKNSSCKFCYCHEWRREFIALSTWHDMFSDSDADVTRLVNSFMITHSVIHFYLLMNSIPFLMLLCSSGMAFSINCASYSIVLGIPRFFSTPFFQKKKGKTKHLNIITTIILPQECKTRILSKHGR